MKRWMSTLLAMALVIGMAACSQQAEEEASGSAQTSAGLSAAEAAGEPEEAEEEEEEETEEEEAAAPGASEQAPAGQSGTEAPAAPAGAAFVRQEAAPQAGQSSVSTVSPAASQPQAPASLAASQPQAQQESAAASQSQAQTQAPAASGNPLAKYPLEVVDADSSAVDVIGRDYDGRSGYVFSDREDRVVGFLPLDDVLDAIRTNGLSHLESAEQREWFVHQFNLYRGLEEGVYLGGSDTVSPYDQESYRQEVFRLTNEEREKAGLEPLVMYEPSMEYAQTRAEEISTYFSHYRPEGKESVLIDGLTYMENIAKGYRTPEEVVEGWMNSPGHRASMMGDYSDYGNRMGVGVYRYRGVIYWVQEFVLWDQNA